MFRLRFYRVDLASGEKFVYAELPSVTVEELRTKVNAEKVLRVEPLLHQDSAHSAEKKRRYAQSTRGEDLLTDFWEGGVDTFGEEDDEIHGELQCGPREVSVFRTQFPFTDAQSKRILVHQGEEEEEERISLQMTGEQSVCESIRQRLRLLHQSSTAPVTLPLLYRVLDRYLASRKRDCERLRSFFGSEGERSEELSMLLLQYALMVKKGLIVHEQHDDIEWQESAWVNYADLKSLLANLVPSVGTLDLLSLLSVRPQLLRGWLLKKGEKGISKSWRKRWFAQKGKKLFYYKDDGDKRNPLGYIPLDQLGRIEDRSSPSLGDFIAVQAPGRVFFLVPATKAEEERRFWITNLKNWKNYLRHQTYNVQEEAEAGLMNGYLWKKGEKGVRGWQRRWFAQIGSRLFYYADNKTRAKGSVDLQSLSWVHFPHFNPKLKIRLHTLSDERVWRLKCDTREEYEAWRQGILCYCSTAPPMNSKYFKEAQDKRIMRTSAITLAGPPPEALALRPDQLPEALEDEAEMEQVSPSKPRRRGSLPLINSCRSCSTANGSLRNFCCFCGTKLDISVRKRGTVSRRATLAPLPADAPDKSDVEAYEAFMALKAKHDALGSVARRRKVLVVAKQKKRKEKKQRDDSSSSSEEESVIWAAADDEEEGESWTEMDSSQNISLFDTSYDVL